MERNSLVTALEHDMLPDGNLIRFTVYLHPIIYEDSKVMEGVEYDNVVRSGRGTGESDHIDME